MTARQRVAMRILAIVLAICIVPTMALAQTQIGTVSVEKLPIGYSGDEEEADLAPRSSLRGASQKIASEEDITVGYSASDFEGLVDAIQNAPDGEVILIKQDITFDDTIKIDEDKSLNLVSDGGQIILYSSAKRHFIINSGEVRLTFTGIVLNGKGKTGGILVEQDASLTLTNAVITNCAAQFGGGIHNSGDLTITGGAIINNEAPKTGIGTYNGGGIYNLGTLAMNGTEISGNASGTNGGGIHNTGSFMMHSGKINNNGGYSGGGILNTGTFIMQDGEINGNTASNGGGGIFTSGTVTIYGGSITGNTSVNNGGGINNSIGDVQIHAGEISGNAGKNGGGVYNGTGTVAIKSGYVSGNTAGEGGGGLYTKAYDKLTVGADVVFGSNTASRTYNIKEEDIITYNTYIKATQFTNGYQYGYNNYDINYISEALEVIFNANGGAPEPDLQTVDYGERAKEPLQPELASHSFSGWFRGDSQWNFDDVVTSDMTLEAHWDEILFTASFDANGGAFPNGKTVKDVVYLSGSEVEPPEEDPEYEEHIFQGWSLEKGGELYTFAGTAGISGDMNFYAVWQEIIPEPGDDDGDDDGNVDEDDHDAGSDDNGSGEGDDNSGNGENGSDAGGNSGGSGGSSGSSGSDKDSGTDNQDNLDGNDEENTSEENANGNTTTSGGSGSGGRDSGRTVSVGRDVYINDTDIPLANELLAIFDEEVPLTEVKLAESNLFDIPDTGNIAYNGLAGFLAITSMALGILSFKRED